MDLFATIIRQQHITSLQLTKKIKGNPQKTTREMVDELTEQYLLKILRPNVRLCLANFSTDVKVELSQLNLYNRQIRIRKSISNEIVECSLGSIFRTFLRMIGCHNQVGRFFIKTLVDNPIRTVVQLVDAIFDYKYKLLDEDELAFRLCEIFFIQIHAFGFSPFSLHEELKSPHGITHLMEALVQKRHVTLGMELLPNFTKSYVNVAILALQVNFIRAAILNPEIVYVYIFKACLFREILNRKSIFTEREILQIMSQYLYLEHEEPLYKTSKRISALLWSHMKNSNDITLCGTLRLPNEHDVLTWRSELADKCKFPEFLHDFDGFYKVHKNFMPFDNILCDRMNTLSLLKDGIFSWHKIFITLCEGNILESNSISHIISIFPILSLMGDIVKCQTEQELLDLFTTVYKIDNLSAYEKQNFIKEHVRAKAKPYTSVSKKLLHRDNKQSNETDLMLFIHYLLAWSDNTRKNIEPALYATMASRIMNRFIGALQSFTNHSDNFLLGNYIHRCLITFFYSVLIEESLLLRPVLKIKYDFILSEKMIIDDSFFMDTINHLNSNQREDVDNYAVFQHIFSCPIWGFYIKHDKQNDSVFQMYFKNMTKKYACTTEELNICSKKILNIYRIKCEKSNKDTLYELLNTVYINHSVILSQHGVQAGLNKETGQFDSKKIISYLSEYFPRLSQDIRQGCDTETFERIVDVFYIDYEVKKSIVNSDKMFFDFIEELKKTKN